MQDQTKTPEPNEIPFHAELTEITSILESLHSVPQWFLNVALAELPLNMRTRHVFEREHIVKVEDFMSCGREKLLTLQDFGLGSLKNAEQVIKNRLDQGEFHASSPVLIKAVKHQKKRSSIPDLTKECFLSCIKRIPDHFRSNELIVWRGRIGRNAKPLTFDEIGKSLNLTRERIRQIELKAQRKVKYLQGWSEMRNRLTILLTSRKAPLLLSELEYADDWFKGVSCNETMFGLFLSRMLEEDFHVLEIGNKKVVSLLSPAEWSEICKSFTIQIDQELANRLKNFPQKFISESNGYAIAKAFLPVNSKVLHELLWTETTKNGFIHSVNGENALAALNQTLESSILHVLRNSESILHLDQITESVHSIFPQYERHGNGYLRNTVHQVGLLFARNSFGLMKHCPLNLDELSVIRSNVNDIMLNKGSIHKQWHASELFDLLCERGLNNTFDGLMTKYIVAIALQQSPSFVNLGRLMWMMQSPDLGARNTVKRKKIHDLVEDMLEKNKKSMSRPEILKKLNLVRGVNATFQIHPVGRLIGLGDGVFGLAGRDDLTVQEQQVESV